MPDWKKGQNASCIWKNPRWDSLERSRLRILSSANDLYYIPKKDSTAHILQWRWRKFILLSAPGIEPGLWPTSRACLHNSQEYTVFLIESMDSTHITLNRDGDSALAGFKGPSPIVGKRPFHTFPRGQLQYICSCMVGFQSLSNDLNDKECSCQVQRIKHHHQAMQDLAHLYKKQKNHVFSTILEDLSHLKLRSYWHEARRRRRNATHWPGPNAWTDRQRGQNNTSYCEQQSTWSSHVRAKDLTISWSGKVHTYILHVHSHRSIWGSHGRARGQSIHPTETNVHILQNTGM